MKQNESHFEDLKEWQEKQYLPGYYVGGKIPPILKQRTKGLAYGLLGIGGFFLLLSLGMFYSGSGMNAGVYAAIGLLFLVAWIKVATNLRKKRRIIINKFDNTN